MVETLKAATRRVGALPVPQVSTGSMPGGRTTGTAASSMASTMPVSSSTVSSLMRMATA